VKESGACKGPGFLLKAEFVFKSEHSKRTVILSRRTPAKRECGVSACPGVPWKDSDAAENSLTVVILFHDDAED
jgi:hypothetical protein